MEIPNDLNKILKEAVALGASDVHLTEGARPRCRIIGELRDMNYDVIKHDVFLKYLMPPNLDALLKRTLHDDKQLDISYEIQGVSRFRVNIFWHRGALAAVYRILKETVPEFVDLGLPVSVLNLSRERRGMVLVTGVTGSGKSTTLASLVDNINRNMRKHIITLEEPVEYRHWHRQSNVCQREVGRDVKDFNSGLVAALREDPDVILVGEMRDLETMQTALLAAETGHLLLSTLHTMGAAETVDRVIDTFPDGQHTQIRNRLANTLSAVVSQQLLPRADKSGYVVAYEVLYTSRTLKDILRTGTSSDIRDYMETKEAIEDGVVSMDACIFSLYQKGLITADIAISYAFDRKIMTARIEKFLLAKNRS